jgi:hypothetical protein
MGGLGHDNSRNKEGGCRAAWPVLPEGSTVTGTPELRLDRSGKPSTLRPVITARPVAGNTGRCPMKELRCLVFSEQEVVSAVVERRRRLREKLPEGSIQRVDYSTENGVSVTIHVVNDNGKGEVLVIQETEAAAALVNFCMSRKIPMPVDSDKYLQVINDGMTLMITMRFNKQHRGSHAGI